MTETPAEKFNPFKIAFRVEGAFVVAYFSSIRMYDGSMEPIEIARFRKTALQQTPNLFEDFQVVVRKAVTQLCLDLDLPRPNWHTQRAPEDERAGDA